MQQVVAFNHQSMTKKCPQKHSGSPSLLSPTPLDQVQELIIDYPQEMVQETGWREKPSVDTPPPAVASCVKSKKKNAVNFYATDSSGKEILHSEGVQASIREEASCVVALSRRW